MLFELDRDVCADSAVSSFEFVEQNEKLFSEHRTGFRVRMQSRPFDDSVPLG